MDRINEEIKILHKCIIENTSAMWQHSPQLNDGHKKKKKSAYLLKENIEIVSEKKKNQPQKPGN